jgi:hypothetical protein
MQVIQQRRVGGAEESFGLKDLSALDSCDKHRNEGWGGCIQTQSFSLTVQKTIKTSFAAAC